LLIIRLEEAKQIRQLEKSNLDILLPFLDFSLAKIINHFFFLQTNKNHFIFAAEHWTAFEHSAGFLIFLSLTSFKTKLSVMFLS